MFDLLDSLNKDIFLALNFEGGPFLDIFFWIVTSKVIWIPLYLYMIWLIYKKTGGWGALIAAAAMGIMVGLTDQTCNFFKDWLPTLRPSHNPELSGMVHTIYGYAGGLSGTVSAHAAISFSIAIFSSLVLRKRFYTILIIFWALLVAYSRIYSGLHYPRDLFFGIVTGSSIALIIFHLYGMVMQRLNRRAAREILGQVNSAASLSVRRRELQS